ncbi:beta-1,6-N-acetylglucosaminyltransferase [Dyadobacter sp. CY347]|uniref:beta-1,6-N-acetylglucosaminyltransferase n=1 Tax=Dyadobacter sp. CY347 TaxID=2909336 RepID=UPI001F3ED319|nr:beta-1,6-N-acetylglucosaminyltransferase [Dyadobacter sp. CY347]MCF2488798.1 beta-1,6-N-acetylglucosaminyltransferase [Dyadobacter sp. CY347]
MKIAHLILAHSEPGQLARLIRALEHPDAYIFLHIDAKKTLDPFLFLSTQERVHFVNDRIKVGWGAYSIVQATINGFRAIANSGLDIDYVNLLSGSDYPLKDPSEMNRFFQEHQGQNFMHYELVMEEWKEAIPRLTAYHLTNYSFPGKYFVQKWMNRILPARQMPDHLIPVGRSQWMSLTMDAVRYILQYLDTHPEVVRFFKHTWAPDEIIFQTILYNSNMKASMVNSNLRYTKWLEGKASPEILTKNDLEDLLNSGAFFARKMDPSKSSGLLDRLDRQILNLT